MHTSLLHALKVIKHVLFSSSSTRVALLLLSTISSTVTTLTFLSESCSIHVYSYHNTLGNWSHLLCPQIWSFRVVVIVLSQLRHFPTFSHTTSDFPVERFLLCSSKQACPKKDLLQSLQLITPPEHFSPSGKNLKHDIHLLQDTYDESRIVSYGFLQE